MGRLAPGLGIGTAILRAIIAEAARRGYACVLFETGTDAAFAAARALYERHGFRSCPPFGAYQHDPLSVFYARTLRVQDQAQ